MYVRLLLNIGTNICERSVILCMDHTEECQSYFENGSIQIIKRKSFKYFVRKRILARHVWDQSPSLE